MAVDKTKNKQMLLTLSKELFECIEQYWHENKLPSRTEAMRELITKGLSLSRE